jgi:hypothetical protein
MYAVNELDENFNIINSKPIAETAWMPLGENISPLAKERADKIGVLSFRRYISDDEKTMVVTFQDENLSTLVRLFNDDFELIQENQMELPYATFFTSGFKASNSGRLYMTGYDSAIQKGKRKRKDKLVANDFHVLIYDAVDGSVQDVEIELDAEVIDVGLKILSDESFVTYGIFANDEESAVNGTFIQKFSKEGEVIFETTTDMTSDLLEQSWSDEWEAGPGYYNKLHDLMIKDNGEFVVLVEKYQVLVDFVTYSDGGGRTTRSYYYEDVYAFNYGAEGDIKWKTKLDKHQVSTNDGGKFASIFPMVVENDVYYLYNLSESEVEGVEEGDSMKERRKQRKNKVCLIVGLDENGEAEKETLFNFEGDKSRVLLPRYCRTVKNEGVFLYTHGNKSEKTFGWISL